MQTLKQAVALAVVLFSVSGLSIAEDAKTDKAAPAATDQKAATETPSGSIEVLRMVLCKDVKDREPADEITSAKVGDVVVGFTQVRSGLGEVNITHRWLHESDNMGDIQLAVKSSPWRTWSRKTLGDAGNWKWQVLDPSGAVLKEVAFTVAPADAASSSGSTEAPAAPASSTK